MAAPDTDDAPVDEDGNRETPAKMAVDKRKKRNLTYAGLALGAIAVVVAIVMGRRSSSTSSSATPASTFDPNSLGSVAGMGSAGTGTSGSGDPFASLESQLATNNAQQLAASNALSTALARLTSELHASGGANQGDQTRTLAKVNASQYAAVLPKGAQVDVVGYETSKGVYSGSQLKLGAPLYALINGQWRQGVNPKAAPAGTVFATTPTFAPYIVPPTAPKLPSPVANPPHA